MHIEGLEAPVPFLCIARSIRSSASALRALRSATSFCRAPGVGRCRLFGHGKHHGFQRFNIIWEFEIGRRHRVDKSTFCPGFPALSGC